MLFAAEKAACRLQCFAARKIDAAARAGDHGLARRRGCGALAPLAGCGALAPLARQALHDEVGDDYGDDQKEELAQTMASWDAAGARFAG